MQLRIFSLALLALALFVTLPHAGHAQRATDLKAGNDSLREGIAAIVNDQIITQSEVAARYRLSLLASGLPDEPAGRAQLMPQVLRTLVDEAVQTQAAIRRGITVSEGELNQALEQIARDNKINGDMRAYIAAQGGSVRALENQVRANISWVKLVQRELRPKIEIGDDEVENVLERQRARQGQQELLLSEIFLSNDNPAEAAQVEAFAKKIRTQLDNGVPFPVLARQFSQGTGAAQGGDLGWLAPAQLAPELQEGIKAASDGQLLGPISTSNGLHILWRRGSRTINLQEGNALRVSLLTAQQDGTNMIDLLERAATLRQEAGSCDSAAARARTLGGWTTTTPAIQPLADVAANLQTLAKLQPLNSWSEPVPTSGGIALVMVCERQSANEDVRSSIANALGQERLENLARRHARELRRAATVQVRSLSE